MNFKLTVLLFTILFSALTESREMRYLTRSPKALLMGDAFTALADDEYTLFYNPAALTRNKGLDVVPLNPNFGFTNALDAEDQARFKDIPSNDTSALAARFTGFPVWIHAAYTPGLKMNSFGISGVYNYDWSLVLRNAVHPVLNVDFRYDKGAVIGYAHEFSLNKMTSLSIGLGFKLLKREGIKNSFDLFGTKLLTLINQSDTEATDILNSLGFSKGKGMGYDAGLLFIHKTKFYEIAFGASVLDIGDTRFKLTQGEGPIPKQDMYINTGFSFSQDFGIIDYRFAYDLKPINEPVDFGRMTHLGIDVGIPFFRFFGGYNEGYKSYGINMDILIGELTLGFFQVELGSKYKEQPGKRFILQMELLDFLF